MIVERICRTLVLCLLAVFPAHQASAFPLAGDQTVLPPGTELNEDALYRPREVFKSQALGGAKSYLVNLGDLAFNSPTILGDRARRAGMSCGVCHVNGAGNGKLFVPGLSSRPGTFDTTGPLFNPKAHNSSHDPVRIPSLRGARYLAPYGNDGRTASLRDFVRNVIVGEFAGPEPSPALLDALVAYIDDIDFLPNPRLTAGGHMAARATPAEQRGEALFFKPFPRDPQLSCAACHIPTAAFLDHKQHTVGSGGLFKTPTLLNANFNAPYFHDGRYDTLDEVVAHFDRTFKLGLAPGERSDLVAYLMAVGDGEEPYERDGLIVQLREINDFVSVLAFAIPDHDTDVIALAVQTVGRELRELAEQFPPLKDTTITGGAQERMAARKMLKDMVLTTRRIGVAASSGRFDDAAAEYRSYRALVLAPGSARLLKAAEPWSLFNPMFHSAHFGGLRELLASAGKLPR